MHHQRSRFVVGLVMVAAVVSCDAITDEGDDRGALKDLLSFPEPTEPLELIVEMPDEVAEGEAIPMKMVLRNTGAASIVVAVASSSGYDFWVVGPNEDIVKNRLGKIVAPLGPGSETLRPNDTLEFEWTWDQRDDDGDAVGSGTYQVIGTLDVDAGIDVRSEPASVTIR